MTAKHNRIKATRELEPVDWLGTSPGQFTSHDEWAEWMCRECAGQYVAFDHPEHGRAYGQAVKLQYVGNDERGIPDFDVSVKSLRTDKTITVRLVSARCAFYTRQEDAIGDLKKRATNENKTTI